MDSYEIGLKNQFFERRLTLNADVFLAKYNNSQEEVQHLSAATGADETVVENAGAATYSGVEIESHALLGNGFSLDAALGYLDAHFDSFDANLNANYTSSQYTSLTPIDVVDPSFTLRKANTILNTTVALSSLDDKYRVSIWIKNLTDQHALRQVYGRTAFGSRKL